MRGWIWGVAAAALAVPVATAIGQANDSAADAAMVANGAEPANTTAAAALPQVSRDILHVQVILDKLGFSPGMLNGTESESLTNALRGFQQARGLEETGAIDADTLMQLYQYRGWRPTKQMRLSAELFDGPFLNPIPDDPQAQSKLDALPYRSPIEKVAEMFHTTPAVLVALNGRDAAFGPGAVVTLPNALPVARDYPGNFDPEWRRVIGGLNVDSTGAGQAARVTVSRAEGVVKVWNEQDELIAQFNATLGSSQFPLPIGEWEINGVSFNPDWRFDPDLIANTRPGAEVAIVPPGPNNPVGVVWIDLSKEHYGIHGTPEPQDIGQGASNGCIRLTNWDAARLALMVGPGVPAIFTE